MTLLWICGAKGLLGSHLTRLCQQKKIPHLSTSHQEVDIADLEAVTRFCDTHPISHIINCAAYTHVDRAESCQEEAERANVVGPRHLGLMAQRHQWRLIHFSTDYVFDGLASIPYDETHPCHPLNVYGMSKWQGEQELLSLFPQACIIRTSWLFGHPGTHFVSTMLTLMSQREEVRVVADQVGCPTYCPDLAKATLSLLDCTGIFHFSNHGETSRFDFADAIYKQAKALFFPLRLHQLIPVSMHDYPSPALRPRYSVLDTSKISCQLGFSPRPWHDALTEYFSHLEINP